MSFGSDSTQNQNSTTQVQLPQWVQDAGQNNYNIAAGIAGGDSLYTGPTAVGASPLQRLANSFAKTNMTAGSDAASQASQNAFSAPTSIGFTPGLISAGAPISGQLSPIGTSQVGTSQVQAGAPVTADQIRAGQLASTDLTPYMNPFTQNVKDTSLAALGRSLQDSQNANDASASAAGAFGGSRAAVQRAATAVGGAQQAGLLSSQLDQANFQQAQQGALADIGSRLTADTTNAGNKIQTGEFNSGQQMAASSANAANTLAASQANAGNALSASSANAAQKLQGLLSDASNSINTGNLNNQYGLQTAAANAGQYNTSVAQQLAAANGLTNANNSSLAGLLSAGGQQQQTQQNLLNSRITGFNQPITNQEQMLSLLQSSLGMTPYNTTTSSTGTIDKSTSPDFATAGLGLLKLFM